MIESTTALVNPPRTPIFPVPKAEPDVCRVLSSEVIRERGNEECDDVRAHVPAIGQQRHRVRNETDGDLEHHHYRGDADHDARAPLRARKIRNEIVRVLEV